MIICKRLVPPDDHLQEAGPSRQRWPEVTGQKEEKEEKEKEEKEEKNVEKKFLRVGTQTGGPIKGNTRGPRRPKNGAGA